MPRIDKTLPPNRADYSFGDLLYWHLFVHGTRPEGDPSARAGRKWDAELFSKLVGISNRTLRNWIADKHLPDSIVDLEAALFGDNPAWDDARMELAEALRRTKAAKRDAKSALRGQASGAEADAAHPTPSEADNTAPVDSSGTETTGKDRKCAPDEELASADAASDGPARDDRKSPEKDEFREAGASDPEEEKPSSPKRTGNILPVRLFPEGGSRRPGEGPEDAEGGSQGQRRAQERSGGFTGGRTRQGPGYSSRRFAALAVTGITIAVGMYAWLNAPRIKPTLPTIDTTTGTKQPPGTDPGAKPPPGGPGTTTTQPPGSAPGPQTTLPPGPGVQSPPPTPPPVTEEEKRAEREKRILQRSIEALREAHEKAKREREQEAIRLDRQGPKEAAARAQREREWNARQVAGMGYSLIEYNAVTGGTSLGHVQTDTVYDCALSCLADRCDAFSWFRDERPSGPRTCHRYKGPVTFYDNPGYTAGKKSFDILPGGKLGAQDAPSPARPRQYAEAGPPAASDAEADGIVHCPTGPVKVTGFTLTCDQTLGGGTTLGSNRLSWTVNNINECAAKCRPIKNCVGFAYSAAGTGGHSCILFGPTPEPRESQGWISGERPVQ